MNAAARTHRDYNMRKARELKRMLIPNARSDGERKYLNEKFKYHIRTARAFGRNVWKCKTTGANHDR